MYVYHAPRCPAPVTPPLPEAGSSPPRRHSSYMSTWVGVCAHTHCRRATPPSHTDSDLCPCALPGSHAARAARRGEREQLPQHGAARASVPQRLLAGGEPHRTAVGLRASGRGAAQHHQRVPRAAARAAVRARGAAGLPDAPRAQRVLQRLRRLRRVRARPVRQPRRVPQVQLRQPDLG